MSSLRHRPIFYDTETTGIRPTKDRIIEIAAFDPVRSLTFEMLVNPGIPIPEEATKIHHITNEMVEKAPLFHEVGQKFQEFSEGDVVLIAHNNDSFDLLFLQQEFERHQLPWPKSWKFLDSLKWARRYRSDLPRHSLQFLREVYGISANNAHRALDDVIILHQVFDQMIDDLEINQVCSLMNAPKVLAVMPFGKYQGEPLAKIPKDYVSWLHKSGFFEKPGNEELKNSFQHLGLLRSA